MNNRDQQIRLEGYADLLNGQPNAEQTQLVQVLDTMYSAANRPEELTWARLKLRYMQTSMEKQASLPRAFFRPSPKISLRMGISLAAVLLMLLTVGTAYAQFSGLIGILWFDPGAQYLQNTHQYVKTNMSQSIQGFTVTFQQAYADGDRVIIGYTIETPKDHRYSVQPDGLLYVDQAKDPNAHLRLSSGIGHSQVDRDIHSMAFTDSFTTPTMQGSPDTIHLRYVITEIKAFIADGLGTPPTEKSTPVPPHELHLKEIAVSGHIQFDITVPFHKGLTVHVGQQQVINGKTIILDHVDIAQSEVRVYLQGVSYDGFNIADLTIGNGSQKYHWTQADGKLYLGGTVMTFPYALTNHPGNWTLTVRLGAPGQNSGENAVFHFTVPQK